MSKRVALRIFAGLVFFSLVLTAVLISWRTFHREGDRRQQALITNTTVNLSEGQEISVGTILVDAVQIKRPPKIILLVKINSIDVSSLVLKLTVTPVPIGSEFKAPKLENAPVINMTLVIAEKIFKIKANENISPIEVSFNIDGDVNRYPFDQYYKEISPILYDSDKEDIPMGIIVTGGLQGLRMNVIDFTDKDGDINLLFDITRSKLTLAFSLFIILIMWIISLMLLGLVIVVWVKGITISPPLLAVPVGCLFALPTIRNSQPTVPPVGTLGDILGFFWNMTFASVAVIILFTLFMVRSCRPPVTQ